MAGIVLDLQKVFYCIEWGILIEKLAALGIRNTLMTWIEHYFY